MFRIFISSCSSYWVMSCFIISWSDSCCLLIRVRTIRTWEWERDGSLDREKISLPNSAGLPRTLAVRLNSLCPHCLQPLLYFIFYGSLSNSFDQTPRRARLQKLPTLLTESPTTHSDIYRIVWWAWYASRTTIRLDFNLTITLLHWLDTRVLLFIGHSTLYSCCKLALYWADTFIHTKDRLEVYSKVHSL